MDGVGRLVVLVGGVGGSGKGVSLDWIMSIFWGIIEGVSSSIILRTFLYV